MTYAETYTRAAAADADRASARSPKFRAARQAFLQSGKPSLSIRKRVVLPRDDLDERLQAAITAYFEAQEA